MKYDDKNVLINYRIQQARAALEEAGVLLSMGNGQSHTWCRESGLLCHVLFCSCYQHIDKVPRKHSGAIALFDEEFVKKGIFSKELSRNLHNTFESRQASDYMAATPIDREEAEEIIQNAIAFLEAIEKYLQEACLD